MSVKRVRRVRWGRVTAAIIGGALAVTLLTGAYRGDQKLVQTVYTVREGDTLRDISERFLPLNTGGSRYILEFEEGIVELNPELQQDRGKIYPGQKIRINYWVAREIDTVRLADGAMQFKCVHKITGKQGRVSPAFKYKDTGRQAYFITWEP